jgi:hypothetical protein
MQFPRPPLKLPYQPPIWGLGVGFMEGVGAVSP